MVRIVRGLALALYCLALPAAAQTTPDWPPAIQRVADKGVTIIESFEAPGGLTGYAARAGGRPLALYLTADGEHVIIGTLLDAEGRNLTADRLDALVTAPSLQEAWPRLDGANWIADGDADAPITLYVFTDPNCGYCHRFYELTRPWVDAGAVQLRHILVGIMRPSSPAKAAAILSADDPAAALQAHEANYQTGGVEPMADPPPAIERQIARHNQLMAGLGMQGTPGIVYRTADGRIATQQGVPQGELRERMLGPKPD